jgi:hypothetical protein
MQQPHTNIQPTTNTLRDRVAAAKRAPVRVTITINHNTHERLITRSTDEGRSVSNLCAYLLESSLSPFQ